MTSLRRAARVFGDTRIVEWMGPALAFLVCLFCFGILLSRLGYFQDDWHHVFFAYWQGAAGLKRFLLIDRGPFAWPVYAALFGVLGYSPTAWHWLLMLVRFLTVVIFWLCARCIWPHDRGLVSWLGLLFAVYPIFTLQPLAVAYALHWTMYLIFMLSVFCMLQATARPRWFVLLTILALVLQATHLALIEYFVGLELARPIFLWLLLRDLRGRERVRRAARLAIPYLALLLLYVVYRSSFGAIFGYDRFNVPGTMAELWQTPVASLRGILQVGLQDLVYILSSQWQAVADPALLDLSRSSTFWMLLSMLAFAALTYLVLMRAERVGRRREQGAQAAQVGLAGLLLVSLSMLPFWATGFSIYQKNQLWSERLALAAMPGASMLIVGIVYALMDRPANRHLVLSILLGLAVGLHFQTARLYQASWEKQKQFYWQLHWRAPSLKANTLIVSDQEILFFMGIYPTAFAINLLYPQVTPPTLASYWFNAGFEHMNFDRFSAGAMDSFEKYGMSFNATVEDVVAITFEPGSDRCLWVLRPALTNARGLTPAAKTWLGVSQPSRIQDLPAGDPPPEIFGREPARTWCYYFEKADLAAQYGRWSEVAELWRAAEAADLRAPNGIEMVPFIEAFARLGEWQRAQALTDQARVLPDRSAGTLCDIWRGLGDTSGSSIASAEALRQVREDLACLP